MIEKTQSYKTSDGAVHPTLAEAQIAEIKIQLGEFGLVTHEGSASAISDVVNILVEKADTFAAILGQKPRKPRASKSKATKPAKASAKSPETPKP